MYKNYESLIAKELIKRNRKGIKSVRPGAIDSLYDDPLDFEVFDSINEAAEYMEDRGLIKVTRDNVPSYLKGMTYSEMKRHAFYPPRTIKRIHIVDDQLDKLIELYSKYI